MATETRTLHFTLDPALRAYMAWLDQEGLAFSLPGYDVFAAGYRWSKDEDATPPTAARRRRSAGGRRVSEHEAPICPHCEQPMTPYRHDPTRWWFCEKHGGAVPRAARTAAQDDAGEGEG